MCVYICMCVCVGARMRVWGDDGGGGGDISLIRWELFI